MKKLKKVLSFAAAATLTAASVGSMCANAVIWVEGTPFGTVGDYYELVEDYDSRGVINPARFPYEKYNEYTKVFRRINENSVEYEFFNHKASFAEIEITCPESDQTFQDIRSRISDICPEAEVEISPFGRSDQQFFIRMNAYSRELEGILSDEEHYAINMYPEQARQIRDSLAEIIEIDRFDFYYCNYNNTDIFLKFPAVYSLDDSELEVFENYVSENELSFTTEKRIRETDRKYSVSVSPSSNMAVLETYEALDRLSIEADIRPTNVLSTPNIRYSEDIIDVINYIDGDANEDSELTIADAVLIMQSLSNPDKYALTVQGEFNADVTGDGDGITLGDALVVQEILLNN